MENKDKIFDEVEELISYGLTEIAEDRKVVFDKKTGQFSIKLPKTFALKSMLDEKSEFRIIFNTKEETLAKIKKSKLIIYLKEENEKEKANP